MKKWFALLCFLAVAAACSAALGEIAVTVTPENPRMGDYVDVTVAPDRENPESVIYALQCDGQKVFSGKPVQHYTASFRPRQEGSYTLLVTVSYGKNDTETAEITVPVSGAAPEQEGPDVVYSQKDGWWKKKRYSTSELQTAGCAIFTLSHLLQRRGFTGEAVTPEKLAKTYVYYSEGSGTWNEGLIRYSALDYDFTTQKELINNAAEIASDLKRGDYFSFSIADRHIALADGISEDGAKVHIVDSAPGATFERIRVPGSIFFRNGDGSFTEAAVPEDLPGMRWFFETQEYGGMEYWMDISYCASRGMRLVRFPWLKADPGDGEGARSVSIEYAGALITKVTKDKDAWRLPTRDLQITGVENGKAQLALVTAKKGTWLKDISGRKLPNRQKIKRNTMVLLLEVQEDTLYAWWDNAFGFLSPEDVTLLTAVSGDFETGIITKNGNVTGGKKVTVYLEPSTKSTGLAEWVTGTPVAVVEKQDGFLLVEGNGRRGWIQEQFFIKDQNDTERGNENGQEINEGK